MEITCEFCGKKFFRKKNQIKNGRQFCSCECKYAYLKISLKGVNISGFFKKGNKRENCINFKEGKQKCNGYVMILDHNHPHRNKKNYIYEHRVVMEKHIRRYLEPTEVVHHIDFDKKNNDIANLMLFENDKEHRKYHIELRKNK